MFQRNGAVLVSAALLINAAVLGAIFLRPASRKQAVVEPENPRPTQAPSPVVRGPVAAPPAPATNKVLAPRVKPKPTVARQQPDKAAVVAEIKAWIEAQRQKQVAAIRRTMADQVQTAAKVRAGRMLIGNNRSVATSLSWLRAERQKLREKLRSLLTNDPPFLPTLTVADLVTGAIGRFDHQDGDHFFFEVVQVAGPLDMLVQSAGYEGHFDLQTAVEVGPFIKRVSRPFWLH
ncbi:MAG TPA: hypothetical protein VFA18_25580, partial [Gemmataceae bacterium]|nr:hypothetical protein [Gemmataceae bacterium]